VLAITTAKEGYDDFNRYRRDKGEWVINFDNCGLFVFLFYKHYCCIELNSATYYKLTSSGMQPVTSGELKVGDLVQVSSF
jgi:hypothetical protein